MEIALGGVILGFLVYAPLVLYLVWSWRWLRRNASRNRGGKIWLQLPIIAAAVSAIWSVVVNSIAVFYVLLTYNLSGDELLAADAVLTVAFLPAKAAFALVGLLPGMPVYYQAPFLHWLLAAAIIMASLLLANLVEWLIIRGNRIGLQARKV